MENEHDALDDEKSGFTQSPGGEFKIHVREQGSCGANMLGQEKRKVKRS